MSNLLEYEVLRPLDGDRTYLPGDKRLLSEADATPLVKLGCLRKIEKAEAAPIVDGKAAEEPTNKKAPDAQNKAKQKN